MVGVSCTYDVFDQQFASFFTSFFATGEQGTRVFGYVTTMGELLNASIMFFAPLIVNRIGGKNALLLAGTIMSVRIIGSSFATTALEVVILKTLHMFEIPFLIVGCFKYITSQFEVRFSATIYLVCFCFFKQLAMIFMSVLAGKMYESIGFRGAYLVLGIIALSFTLISVFTLSGPGPFSCCVVAKASRCKTSLPDAPLAWFIRPTILKGPVSIAPPGITRCYSSIA